MPHYCKQISQSWRWQNRQNPEHYEREKQRQRPYRSRSEDCIVASKSTYFNNNCTTNKSCKDLEFSTNSPRLLKHVNLRGCWRRPTRRVKNFTVAKPTANEEFFHDGKRSPAPAPDSGKRDEGKDSLKKPPQCYTVHPAKLLGSGGDRDQIQKIHGNKYEKCQQNLTVSKLEVPETEPAPGPGGKAQAEKSVRRIPRQAKIIHSILTKDHSTNKQAFNETIEEYYSHVLRSKCFINMQGRYKALDPESECFKDVDISKWFQKGKVRLT